MKLTRQHRRNARLLWQAVSVNDVPDVNRIREAVRTVRQYEGRDAESVLRCFVERLKIYIRANRVGVISADPLSAQQQNQLSELFHGTESVNAGINFSVEPAVIGGLRLEKGHQVTDMTIARQLEILKDRLLKN
jgi:F-type H+-transporting ATPase subunit delta